VEFPLVIEAARAALEDLEALLLHGSHAALEAEAERLSAPLQAALEDLREAARTRPLRAEEQQFFHDLCERLARVRALVSHAEQVQAGLRGILTMCFEEEAGAGYSRRGVPEAALRAQRIVAEA
jgi:hypothetical protein